MLTEKFLKRSFTLKFYVKVWSCNNPFRDRRNDAGIMKSNNRKKIKQVIEFHE